MRGCLSSQQEILILKSTAVQSRRDDSRRKLDSSPNNPRNLLRPRCDSDDESTDVDNALLCALLLDRCDKDGAIIERRRVARGTHRVPRRGWANS